MSFDCCSNTFSDSAGQLIVEVRKNHIHFIRSLAAALHESFTLKRYLYNLQTFFYHLITHRMVIVVINRLEIIEV